MRVLVIGGSGYLGTLVLPFLVERHDLRVLDPRPPAGPVVEYVQGSACDFDALSEAVAGMEAVLYMAMGSYVRVGGDDWGTIESRVNAFDVNVKGLHLALHQRGTHGKQIVSGSTLAMPAIDAGANAIAAQLVPAAEIH